MLLSSIEVSLAELFALSHLIWDAPRMSQESRRIQFGRRTYVIILLVQYILCTCRTAQKVHFILRKRPFPLFSPSLKRRVERASKARTTPTQLTPISLTLFMRMDCYYYATLCSEFSPQSREFARGEKAIPKRKILEA